MTNSFDEPDVSESSDACPSASTESREVIGVPVRPTAYHRQLLDYLKTQEAELWKWFSSHQARQQSVEAVKLELLKTAYRLDRESASELYEQADAVRQRMHMAAEVTLYQAQHASGLNASLAWLPGEAHIVLHGPVQETLSGTELSALLAHEMAHHELYSLDDGAYLVMEQILSAMIADQAADAPHDRTWRSHRLYTELHCDRRAAAVTEDMHAVVRTLVKMETGLKAVNAEAYLKQAAEVLAGGISGSEGITHPEMYIRARALQLWQGAPENPDGVDERLRILIEGPLEMQQLDLLQQSRMVELTRDVLTEYLSPTWLQTDLVLGHAKRFFEDFRIPKRKPKHDAVDSADADTSVTPTNDLNDRIGQCDDSLKKYLCFLLLDFVTCDPDLEEAPLAAAFEFADRVSLISDFRDLAAQELKLGKRALQKVEVDALNIVKTAASAT
ncbi:MAG: hypothetical protein R3C59_17670 [Planctomycetaceae bacterium]